MPARNAREFLRVKVRGLAARLHRLGRIDNAFVGLRPQDMTHAPSRAHFDAANQRLAKVECKIFHTGQYVFGSRVIRASGNQL